MVESPDELYDLVHPVLVRRGEDGVDPQLEVRMPGEQPPEPAVGLHRLFEAVSAPAEGVVRLPNPVEESFTTTTAFPHSLRISSVRRSIRSGSDPFVGNSMMAGAFCL